jgi:hypothetical protein
MQYSPPIPLPIPIRGLNRKVPLGEMPPEYCAWAVNFDPEAQFIKIRNGYVIHAIAPSDVSTLFCLAPWHNSSLFAYGDRTGGNPHRIYDVTTSTVSSAHTTGSDTADEVAPIYYADRLSFIAEAGVANCARTYDGSTWNTFDFSPNGVRAGFTYKGRVFLTNGGNVLVSALSAITGAVDTYDFSTLFTKRSNIRWGGVLTSTTNRSDEQYVCFCSADGEILVYAGDHPGALNWEQIARFETAENIGFTQRAMTSFKNDILAITKEGVVSVRRLWQDFEDPNDYFLTKDISPYWREFVRNMIEDANYDEFNNEPSIAYWPEQNKIYVLMNGHLNEDGSWSSIYDYSTMFVYNTVSKAWQIHKMPSTTPSVGIGGVSNIVYKDNNIYFISNSCVMKVGTGFQDEVPDRIGGTYQAYTVELKSAYQNYSRSEKYKKVGGFDLIVNTDFTGSQIGMKAASDMGRKVSQRSTQAFISGYSNPFYSVGVDGTFIQWRIEGTSDTAASDGFELHSVGVSVK